MNTQLTCYSKLKLICGRVYFRDKIYFNSFVNDFCHTYYGIIKSLKGLLKFFGYTLLCFMEQIICCSVIKGFEKISGYRLIIKVDIYWALHLLLLLMFTTTELGGSFYFPPFSQMRKLGFGSGTWYGDLDLELKFRIVWQQSLCPQPLQYMCLNISGLQNFYTCKLTIFSCRGRGKSLTSVCLSSGWCDGACVSKRRQQVCFSMSFTVIPSRSPRSSS